MDRRTSRLVALAGLVLIVGETAALFSFGAIGPIGLAAFGPSPLVSALAVTGWVGLGLSIGCGLTMLSHMEFDREDGRFVYEIRLLQNDGKVVKLEIDASNGKLISMKRKK